MKRITPIILSLILLCGCGKETGTAPTDNSTAAPTEPVTASTYVSDSSIEQSTNGAVRQYALPEAEITWIAPIYGGVLVAEAGEQSVLSVLSGENGTVTATANIPVKLDNNSVWQVTPVGFAYYDASSRMVVFLDLQLTQKDQLQLPEDITGDPAISPDGTQVYYCQGQTVCSMEVERKISRPVRTNTCQDQTLLGCYLDGTVVACSVQDALGDWSTLYISGENGDLLHKDNGIQRVYSYGDDYFALRTDGIVSQYIFGSTDGSPAQMNISDTAAYGALELGGIIGQTQTADGVLLSFYNMKKTAAVTLPPDMKLAQVAADSTTGGVWLLTESGELLCWSLQASAVTEDADYTGTIYTAEAPDTAGLEACAERADALGKQHGVVIRIWERALVSNDDYDIEVEYQPEAINEMLDALETEFAKFPEKFLYKSVSGQIRICIVRSIGGEITGAYHWYDGDPFIVLSAGVNVEQVFMEAFSHILDIHVLGNSPLADHWDTLNPEGFTYGAETTAMTYLEGETQAFTDRHAMESVTDDRASVFYYAMQSDNAKMFQSEIMQAKLLMLCQAIRDAWRLEEKPETYLWEQYLNESLAYSQ